MNDRPRSVQTPALALIGFYFSAFASLGIFLPYFNLYLLHLGLSPGQIGVIAAVPPAVKVLVPAFFGLSADRRGHRRGLIIGMSLATTVAFSFLLGVSSFIGILAVMFAYALVWSPILPLVEATAMETIDRFSLDYGRVRLWGSLGFIAATAAMGVLLDHFVDRIILYGIVSCFIAMTSASLGMPRPAAIRRSVSITLGSLFRRREPILFYLACLLMQFGHGTYYGFFSIALETRGFSASAIGSLWTVSVMAEVALMYGSRHLLRRMGAVHLFALTFAAALLRWGIMMTAPALTGLVLAQSLHAFSFGAFHIAAVTIIHHSVPPTLRSTGQTLYSSLAYGVGSGLGLLLNGWLYEAWGHQALFAMSAAASAAGLILALRFITPATQPWSWADERATDPLEASSHQG